MLIIPGEVVTGALVNAIAVVGRQISKAASGLRSRTRTSRPLIGLRLSA